MQVVTLIAVALCAFAGWGLPKFRYALMFSAFIGVVVAMIYSFWLNTTSAGPDPLDAVGYMFAFIFPIGACIIGKGVRKPA